MSLPFSTLRSHSSSTYLGHSTSGDRGDGESPKPNSIMSDADDDDDDEEEGDGDRDVASRISVTHLSNTGSSEGAGEV